MKNVTIRASEISKKYKIGLTRRHDTVRDLVVQGMQSLFHRKEQAARSEFWALKDVSFEIHAGEIVGLVGRNGAGKSTLLKILSRITEPTSGQGKMYGRVGSLLEVGTGFHGELTGRENLFLSGAILGMKRGEVARKFDEIVDFAEVEQFIDTPVKRYSSGMYVRLAFAVAAHLETEILLVDEVLAVGDGAFQQKCLGQIDKAAHRQGRTIVFVSHNLATIENLCTRAILLQRGRVAADGAVRQVVGKYLADISTLMTTPLADRTDREGRGNVRATALEVLDGAGNALLHPSSGQAITLRLHYECRNGQTLSHCRASLTLLKGENPFIVLSTELVDKKALELAGRGSIDFIIPELPLSVSTYSITTYISSNAETEDFVNHAAELPVEDGDFYGTGRNYPVGWEGRSVLVKHSWRQNK